jgi:hypothetical protein
LKRIRRHAYADAAQVAAAGRFEYVPQIANGELGRRAQRDGVDLLCFW